MWYRTRTEADWLRVLVALRHGDHPRYRAEALLDALVAGTTCMAGIEVAVDPALARHIDLMGPAPIPPTVIVLPVGGAPVELAA